MSLQTDCVLNEGSDQSCSHAIACIGGDTLFVGGAVGWHKGSLTGALSNGATCTGDWDNEDGLARFSCSDGQRGRVVYGLVDGETGTAIGSGATGAGRPIEAWTGAQIADYVLRETREVVLQCGVTEVPLS